MLQIFDQNGSLEDGLPVKWSERSGKPENVEWSFRYTVHPPGVGGHQLEERDEALQGFPDIYVR